MKEEKEINTAVISGRVKLIRKTVKYKQKDFAKSLNISGASLSDIEKGKYYPNFEFIKALGKQFNVNLNYVFYGEGEMFSTANANLFSQLQLMAAQNEDIRKFLSYFEQSTIFRYDLLSKAEDFLMENSAKIQREIELKKAKT